MQASTQAATQAPEACASGRGALALHEEARRNAVSLWQLKWQLWKVGQERFFKTSREFRAIDRLCWSDPTCQIRALADTSACRFADKHGDALFRKTVDGTELHSVTMWFYGTLPGPTQDWEWNRIKQFNVRDLLLLEDVHAGAKAFIRRAGHETPPGGGQEVGFQLRQGLGLDHTLLACLSGFSLASPRAENAIFCGPRDSSILGGGRLTSESRGSRPCAVFAPPRNMNSWPRSSWETRQSWHRLDGPAVAPPWVAYGWTAAT